MNEMLAKMVRGLNAALAVIIMLVFAAVGGRNGDPASALFFGLFGFLTATLICGLTAVFVQIEHHLAEIHKLLAKQVTPSENNG